MSMLLFLILFVFTISAMHYISIWQCFGNETLFLKILPLLLSCALMFLLSLARSYNGFGAVFIFFLTYIWLGGIFLWFCTSLIFILLKICNVNIPAYFSLIIAAVLTIIAVCNAAKEPIFTHIEIASSKIKKPVLIAQISDTHLGKNIAPKRLKKLFEKINANKPDIIVFTGDVFEEQKNMQPFTDLFKELSAPCGKYVISGNHEYYGGLEKNKQLFKQAGLTDLDNKTTETCGLIINGVSDVPDNNFLNNLKKQDKFSILLRHQPKDFETLSQKVDLMLSGHTHAGQIWPFTFLVKGRYKYYKGLYTIGDSNLYVNWGAFYWGPPMRLFSNNEVTLVRLNEK